MIEREKNMVLRGIAAAPGIAIANSYVYEKQKEEVINEAITDIEEAISNLESALQQSKKELKKIFSIAVDKLGEKRAAIFEAQIMILDDPILLSILKERLKKEMRVPEFIVDSEISKYTNMMNSSNEPYMKERSHDIEDIKHRIIRNLKKKKWKSRITNDVVVITTSLSPSDAVVFSRANVKGYATDFGGLTSHTAILARSLNIPAVVGIHDATGRIIDGDKIIIDGFKGLVYINPDEAKLDEYRKKLEKLDSYSKELHKLKDLPAITTDGKEIQLLANLDLTEEIDFILHNCAKGIGLVRTEGLFEGYEEFPDEEAQYLVYKEISEKIYPNNAIIRTFDIGGDKVLPADLHEPNPFLGWRGIRLLLDNIPLFKTQVRAILRASTHKNIKIMIPMVTSLEEVRESNKLVEECKKELNKEGKSYDKHIAVGMMIEVPSAAAMARDFAEESDFLSIGTNDLIQYTLAVDRGNDIVSKLYQEFHPAIVRILFHIIKEGKGAKKLVGMCGEMAADPFATPLLIGLGLESFSAAANMIPTLKKIIRNVSYKECKKLANACLKLKTEKEINDLLHEYFNKNLQNHINNLY